MRIAVVCAILSGLSGGFAAAAKAPFTFDAMMKLERIDDPQLSPDGKMVAFTVFQEQTRQCIVNITAILEEAGS